MNVRTADIYLNEAYLRTGVELFTNVGIFINRKAAYICHYRFVKTSFKLWKFFIYNSLDARILQAYGIYHAGAAFGNSRCRISEPSVLCGTLKRKCTEYIYVIKLCKFISVSEGSGSRNNGICKLCTAKVNNSVYFSHMISSFMRTGPSLQILLFPVTVLHEQPIHAPKPQPILSSKLNCPEVFEAL